MKNENKKAQVAKFKNSLTTVVKKIQSEIVKDVERKQSKPN